ncbi:hypothetical protein ASB57_21955 [Bordetella sp. N]|nr:hypothetical protein ASB57_21955 [Bordetella sp. N]
MLLFTLLLGRMVYLHNADYQQATGAWVDSGSLLQDYLRIVGPPVNLNQTHQYHTGIYGWVYNSIVVWGIIALKAVFGGAEIGFPVFAAWAKAVSFAFTVASIGLLFATIRKFGAHYFIALFATLAVAIYPPTAKFSYEVHPEAAGVFFVILMLWSLRHYVEQPAARERYLLLAWAAAVTSVLAKQSFMIYPLAPLLVVFAVTLRDPAFLDLKRQVVSRLAGRFVLIGLLLVLAFHPYAILDFPGFLAKQKEIHAFHATLSMPIGRSFRSWIALMWDTDVWLLVAMGAAVIRLTLNRFRGENSAKLVDICCVLLLVYLVLIVDQLRFYILRAYLLPILPVAAIVLVGLSSSLRGVAGAVVKAAVLILLVGTIPAYALNSAGSVAYDLMLGNFNTMRVRDPLMRLGPRPWTVFFSSSLAVPGQLYKQAIDNFKFGGKADIDRGFANLHPDLVIVDKTWRYSAAQEFEDAALANGMVLVAEMDGESPSQWSCWLHYSKQQCVGQVQQLLYRERFGSPASTDSKLLFYAKPELAPLFAGIK